MMPRVESTEPPAETRSSLRSGRHGSAQAGALQSPTRPRVMLDGATALVAALMILGAHAGPLVLASAYAWCTVVVAWSWAAAPGPGPGWRVAFPVGAAGLLTALGFALNDAVPSLSFAPVALAVGTVLACLLQVVRRDGRSGLTVCLSAAGLGLGIVAMGAAYLPVIHGAAGAQVLSAAFAGILGSAVADLLAGRFVQAGWLMPLATLLGGGAGALVAAFAIAPAVVAGLLVGGFTALVSSAVRQVGGALPASVNWQAQVGLACASVLAPGALAYVAERVLVG